MYFANKVNLVSVFVKNATLKFILIVTINA